MGAKGVRRANGNLVEAVRRQIGNQHQSVVALHSELTTFGNGAASELVEAGQRYKVEGKLGNQQSITQTKNS